MYIVDITRDDESDLTDILIARDSMDAKRKTINYIMEYAFANFGKCLDKDIIDQNLNMDGFCLKEFMVDVYGEGAEKDLLIQSFPADKDYCLFVKQFDKRKSPFPTLYGFHKDDVKSAILISRFIVNDYLIVNYKDTLDSLENRMGQIYSPQKDDSFSSIDFSCGIISLYDKKDLIEELLNNDYSLLQLKDLNKEGIDI